jgi:hypothetical protein
MYLFFGFGTTKMDIPLRSNEFSFQLKKSSKPRSKLTNVARKNLYEDYLFLQVEEQRHRTKEVKACIKLNRGRGPFDGWKEIGIALSN